MSNSKRKRPAKGDLKVDQEYLRSWGDFQSKHHSSGPILLPIEVSIEDGIIARKRVTAGDISVMRAELLKGFETHCEDIPMVMGRTYDLQKFDRMLEDYIEFFDSDNKQSDRPPSPLDFKISRPIWFMFYLPRENWTFTKDRQYSIENDRDDCGRNFEKICTLNGNRILLLANHHRSNPAGLKYNLHITIAQIVDGKDMSTDIIIDPGANNDDTRGGGD